MATENRAFVGYVMADIYALLDFLSGRNRPSPGSPMRTARLVSPLGYNQTAFNDAAIACSSEFVQETTRIARQLDAADADIPDTDVAFLIQARDLLNVCAAPATGNSIIFTLLVIDAVHALKRGLSKQAPAGPIYMYRDTWLEPAALALAKDVRFWLRSMLFFLFVTILLSVYVAYGKLLSDTVDAVNRDHGANLSFLAAELTGHTVPSTPDQDMIDAFCATPGAGFTVYEHCRQYSELKERKKSAQLLLGNWASLTGLAPQVPAGNDASVGDNTAIEQFSAVVIGVIGNYVLPVFYGTIGSLGFILRQFNRRLADRVLTPRESRASRIRLMLGAVSGACIGLFFNSSAGAAQVSGIGGAAVTLSASAVAFLAGYGVEAVFKTLDALLNHVFGLNQQDKTNAMSLVARADDVSR